MIKDYLKMSVSNITNRSLRSWLTMIGIFIGIAAVVSLISLGQGMQTAIQEQFNAMGTDIVILQPLGAGFVTAGEENPVQLTEQDEDIVSKSKGVIETAAWVFRSERIQFKDDINFQFVTGTPADDPDKLRLSQKVSTLEILEGRNLEPGDKFKAVLGYSYTLEDEVFPKRVRIGDKLMVKNTMFDVVGIYEKTGSPPDDKTVHLPLDVAEDLLEIGGEKNKRIRDIIIAQISPGLDPEIVVESIHRQLMNFRGLDEGEEDFQVQTAQQLLGSFNTILAVVQAVLVGIACISLLVGGIGITNTMYTAVLERTREIGIMKAIGAKNRDVLVIFLTESGMLGLVGGAIGVLLGCLISWGVVMATIQMLGDRFLQLYFPPWLIIAGLCFSFIVGAISGVLPAIQASKMVPVDALRYE